METAHLLTNRRLRILWLSHFVPYPPVGGALIRGYNLLKRTAEHHKIDLFAFNQSKLFNSYFSSQQEGIETATEQLQKIVNRLHIEPIPIERHRHGQLLLAIQSLISRAPYTANWLRSDSASRIIAEWIRDGNYDVVHFDTESLAPYLGLTNSLPTIMDHHNAEAHMLLRRARKEASFLKRAYYWQEGHRLARYEKRILQRFTHHIVCSENDKRRLLDTSPSLAITVIPNGIDVTNLQPEREANPAPKLLFIGGLDWYPNRDAVTYFIGSVWPAVKARYPEAVIDIIGKNPPEDIIKNIAPNSGIHFHGFVSDIRPYYRNAAVYICPIRDGGGTKLKILDALAHRLPIVAHPIACEGIEIEEDVHLVTASEPQDMADAICRLLENPKHAQFLGDNGRSLIIEKYSFKEIGLSLARLFDTIAESKNRNSIGST